MSEIPHDLKETLGLPTEVFRSLIGSLKKSHIIFSQANLGKIKYFMKLLQKSKKFEDLFQDCQRFEFSHSSDS